MTSRSPPTGPTRYAKVKKILSAKDLDALEQQMTAEQEELEEAGEPRAAIPAETGEAASI